jgi:hypothetical protein
MGVETKSSFEQEVLTQSQDCQVYGAFSLLVSYFPFEPSA